MSRGRSLEYMYGDRTFIIMRQTLTMVERLLTQTYIVLNLLIVFGETVSFLLQCPANWCLLLYKCSRVQKPLSGVTRFCATMRSRYYHFALFYLCRPESGRFALLQAAGCSLLQMHYQPPKHDANSSALKPRSWIFLGITSRMINNVSTTIE